MGKMKFNRNSTMTNQTETNPTDQAETPKDEGAATETKVTDETTADQAAAVEAPAASEAPVPAAVEEVAPAPAPPASNSAIQDTMVDPKIRSDFNLLTEQFDRYKQSMAKSRPVSEDEGVKAQTSLWRMIEFVLRKDGQAFTVLFSHLLSMMAAERRGGVLDERLRYRFFGALRLGQTEARNFEGILSALLTLSSPQNRANAIKQVDLQRVFLNYSDKAAEARVIEYFGL